MRLVFEPGDFTPESGKTPEVLTDPVYGWSLMVKRVTDGRTVAIFNHRSTNYVVENLSVEVVAAKPARENLPERDSSGKFVRSPQVKVVKAKWENHDEPEPALTGPRLPDTCWFED